MSAVANKKQVNKEGAAYVALILLVICAAAGLLLGIANQLTKNPIAAKKESVNQAAYEAVFPEATNWEIREVSAEEYADIAEVYQCSDGFAIRVLGKGYAGDELALVVGIDNNGNITGMRVVSHSETPGLGARATEESFYTQFDSRSSENVFVASSTGASSLNEIDAITGATKTSRGVVNAVNRACKYYQEYLKEGN